MYIILSLCLSINVLSGYNYIREAMCAHACGKPQCFQPSLLSITLILVSFSVLISLSRLPLLLDRLIN